MVANIPPIFWLGALFWLINVNDTENLCVLTGGTEKKNHKWWEEQRDAQSTHTLGQSVSDAILIPLQYFNFDPVTFFGYLNGSDDNRHHHNKATGIRNPQNDQKKRLSHGIKPSGDERQRYSATMQEKPEEKNLTSDQN